jgi:hypothetical protein
MSSDPELHLLRQLDQPSCRPQVRADPQIIRPDRPLRVGLGRVDVEALPHDGRRKGTQLRRLDPIGVATGSTRRGEERLRVGRMERARIASAKNAGSVDPLASLHANG